ncbi:MAG TPA: heavy-metal-associated domain-containing protein [Chitinophagaceae bacterium]
MKKIFLFITIILSVASTAQVTHISLKASGLTCSMCSNSINKALKTLDFISEVDADISTYMFEISFIPNRVVDLDLIKKKVEQAGFSVAEFVVTLMFDSVPVSNQQPVTIAGLSFLFIDTKSQLLNGVRKLKILDKGFVSAREYKTNAFPVSAAGTYNARIL